LFDFHCVYILVDAVPDWFEALTEFVGVIIVLGEADVNFFFVLL
jgi:hypothetical protein